MLQYEYQTGVNDVKTSLLHVKSVFLYEWWLDRVYLKSLTVVGFVARGSQVLRTSHSAAIVKRHESIILEIVDGIRVTISSLIDRSRTCSNGVPSEVCDHFLHGFPRYWEGFADQLWG
ncbi:hypothetical protein EZV62_006122 [Acer yangbiense]|uniref:SANTA domain-containing protein n=1 Tax=Acer yangbiense TaxID=1000413 RepID=A0A5C7IP79_9ROSI|nr:hypothetical protein EZV62_006122 [Acer yangbiense]